MNPNLWSPQENLSAEQQALLESPFTLDEIRKTVFSCNPNKAPCPDGLPFLFYQTFWDTIQADIIQLFQAFYWNQLDIAKLNLASICLIPKKVDPKLISNH